MYLSICGGGFDRPEAEKTSVFKSTKLFDKVLINIRRKPSMDLAVFDGGFDRPEAEKTSAFKST